MASMRYDRIGEEMKKAISEIIRGMKDPRISDMTTIMSVDVTNDLKQAKVKVSVYDQDDEKRREAVEALNHAAGFITRELGRRVELRALPRLTFLLDNSIEYSVHIAKLLDELKIGEKGEGQDTD